MARQRVLSLWRREAGVLCNVGIRWICDVIFYASLEFFNCSVARYFKCPGKRDKIILAAERRNGGVESFVSDITMLIIESLACHL